MSQYAQNQDYELVKSGAGFIAVHFSKFKIEDNYDRVFFLDAQKRILGTWTGDHSGEFSPIVGGDKMYLRFSTDHYGQDSGFVIDQLSFRGIAR